MLFQTPFCRNADQRAGLKLDDARRRSAKSQIQKGASGPWAKALLFIESSRQKVS
jgi:hypothetical protein